MIEPGYARNGKSNNERPAPNSYGRSAVSSNIKILVEEWEKDGSIGTSHLLTNKKAIRQAVAIALAKAGKSRNTKLRQGA